MGLRAGGERRGALEGGGGGGGGGVGAGEGGGGGGAGGGGGPLCEVVLETGDSTETRFH